MSATPAGDRQQPLQRGRSAYAYVAEVRFDRGSQRGDVGRRIDPPPKPAPTQGRRYGAPRLPIESARLRTARQAQARHLRSVRPSCHAVAAVPGRHQADPPTGGRRLQPPSGCTAASGRTVEPTTMDGQWGRDLIQRTSAGSGSSPLWACRGACPHHSGRLRDRPHTPYWFGC